jgi:Cys-tRNA(Pro)/Cys-tRNA(Cys) deacylase
MVYDEVLGFLKRNGVSFTIHEHPPVVSIAEAEVKAPHLVPNLLKTVVFKIKDAFWVLAAVRCHDRVDYRGIADAFQVNRRQVRSLSPREVEQELGFEIGGVGPIPLGEDIKVVFGGHGLPHCPCVRSRARSSARREIAGCPEQECFVKEFNQGWWFPPEVKISTAEAGGVKDRRVLPKLSEARPGGRRSIERAFASQTV